MEGWEWDRGGMGGEERKWEGRRRGEREGRGKGRDPQGLVHTPHVRNPEKCPARYSFPTETFRKFGRSNSKYEKYAGKTEVACLVLVTFIPVC